MTDNKKLKNAEKIYQTICGVLDKQKLVYDKTENKWRVNYTVPVNGLSIQFCLEIDVERDLINLYAKLPFTFSDERRINGAFAIGQINYCLYDGNFDYNFQTGEVFLRLTASFIDSDVSKDLIDYMMNSASKTLSDYGNKLLALSEGKITLEECTKKP